MKRRKKRSSPAKTSLKSNSTTPPNSVTNELAALFQTQNHKLLEQKANAAIKRWPNNPLGWKALGNLFLMQGQYESALKTLSECIQLDPKDAQVINNVGSIFLQLKRPEEAELRFRQALAVKPDYSQAHNNLGITLTELGRPEDAEKCYQQALKFQPDFAEAHNNLGNAYKTMGDLDRAKECYMRALASNPYLPKTNYNLAMILEEQFGEKEEIMKFYQKALSLDPKLAEAHQSYGNFLVMYGSVEGLKHLELASQLQPNLECLHRQLGTAYIEYGNREKAIANFKIALKQKPDDIIAKYFSKIAEGSLPDDETRTEYVKILFDKFSSGFDKSLVEQLEYKVPAIARDFIEKMYGADVKFHSMVDLGCGTGLSGIAFRNISDHIVGIDLSHEMLDICSDKNVYDLLLQGEITQVLDDLETRFDFFLATEVVIYFQELDRLFTSIKKRTAPGAIFVFSTEIYEGDGFVIKETGRTAHSPKYISDLAKNFEFHIIQQEKIPLRKGKTDWVEGELYILRCQNESLMSMSEDLI